MGWVRDKCDEGGGSDYPREAEGANICIKAATEKESEESANTAHSLKEAARAHRQNAGPRPDVSRPQRP